MQTRAATHGSGGASSQARRTYDGRVSDVSSEIPAMSATDVIALSDGLPTPVTVLVAQRGRWSTIERRRALPVLHPVVGTGRHPRCGCRPPCAARRPVIDGQRSDGDQRGIGTLKFLAQ